MTVKVMDIADVLSEVEMGDKEAEKIIALMTEYKKVNHRTHASLMRHPAFKTLWTAIWESAHFSIRKEPEGEP